MKHDYGEHYQLETTTAQAAQHVAEKKINLQDWLLAGATLLPWGHLTIPPTTLFFQFFQNFDHVRSTQGLN